MEEKEILQAAATIVAGLFQNPNVKVNFEIGVNGDFKITYGTNDARLETNLATIMTSIITGIKNARIEF